MSSAQMVAHHLPYLRRYARALTGGQTSGDAYVAATLEAMIKEPKILDKDANPKVALFRLFTAIWNSLPVNEAAEEIEPDTPAERRLGHLTPRARQASHSHTFPAPSFTDKLTEAIRESFWNASTTAGLDGSGSTM